ncbi:MAG: hypothetical protein IKX95_07920, partial [Lachnospiraceae bacterium]|nr:hypothetical protein [Lachnospiraceae bacterium]
MKKRMICAILVMSLIVAGVHLSPRADVTDLLSDNTDMLELNMDDMGNDDEDLDSQDDVLELSDDDEDGPIDLGGSMSVDVTGDLDGLSDEFLDDEEVIEEIVPDEPDNVVDTGEDDYYEIPKEYVYDDRPFDASYITGEGVDRIRKVIVAYANSLGGTFYSPYYKGGQAVSIQCCAYVNQVWKHVFGKDIYDQGVMTTTSHEGETIYGFLERTGARAGDILYVRYWKVKKNDWSSH